MCRKTIAAIVSCLLVAVMCCSDAFPLEGKERLTQPTKKRPRFVDVGADKCIPCKMMAPALEELREEYAGILDVEFVDVWKNPSEAQKYKIRGIPTQIFYNANGEELARHMGYISKEGILAKFKDLGIHLQRNEKKVNK